MEIGITFCGRTDGRTHLSSNLLGHRGGECDDLNIDQEVFFDMSQSSLRGHSLKLNKKS